MSTDENKALIRRLADELWVKGNVAIIDELLAPDWVDHTPPHGVPPGREGVKALYTDIRGAFSDSETTVDQQIAEGDRVAWQWSYRGTQTGEFQGIPPTGKRATLSGMTIDLIVGGKLVERWSVTDTLGFLQQLEAIPAAQTAGSK